MSERGRGEVVTDGSMGASVRLSGDFVISESLGKRPGGGSNLFHSFSSFDLVKGERATFGGSAENIFARVTGGASTIDGSISTERGDANLFLINSKGVLFGPNSKVEVGGTFTVTTADRLSFGGDGRFDAVAENGEDALLTSQPLESFGFLSSAPAAVTFKGTEWNMSGSRGLSVAAGDVNFRHTQITSDTATNVSVASVASRGSISARNGAPTGSLKHFARLGAITATDVERPELTKEPEDVPNLRTSGSVLIRGGRLTVDSSRIVLENNLPGRSPRLKVNVRNDVKVISRRGTKEGNGEIRATTPVNGDRAVPPLTIRSSSVRLIGDGRGDNNGGLYSSNLGSGAPSGITIHSGRVEVHDGDSITASTVADGDGGAIRIFATQEVLLNRDLASLAAVSGDVDPRRPVGTGNAGEIFVRTPSLRILNGGEISTATFGLGDGGDVTIEAGQIEIDNSRPEPVKVVALKLLFDLSGFTSTPCGILAVAVPQADTEKGVAQNNSDGLGRAGNISIVGAESLSIRNGGIISTSSFGAGAAGTIDLEVGRLFMGSDGQRTGVYSTSEARSVSAPVKTEQATAIYFIEAQGGPGGDIRAHADEIELDRGTVISASSNSPRSTATAGTVQLNVTSDFVSAGGSVSSSHESTGNAGSIGLDVGGRLTLTGNGLINCSSAAQDAGTISIRSTGDLLVQDSSIKASAGRDGGDIDVQARGLIRLTRGEITATAGAFGSDAAAGMGGNIRVEGPNLVLADSLISASAALGRGGDILLQADKFLTMATEIVATGSTDGTVEIASPDLDLENALTPLSSRLVGSEAALQERCTMRLRVETSSFLVVGRGGVAATPEVPRVWFGDPAEPLE